MIKKDISKENIFDLLRKSNINKRYPKAKTIL